MCSTRDNAALPTLGLPIRESADQWLFSASPRLIAAVHALHRLLVPRHPPCALTILTVILGEGLAALDPVIFVSLATVQFSRSAKRCVLPLVSSGSRSSEPPAAGRSLKTQQHAESLRDSVVRNRRFLTRVSPRVAIPHFRDSVGRNRRYLPSESPTGRFTRFGRHV